MKKILVDVGGSGTRTAVFDKGSIGCIKTCCPSSKEELISVIRQTAGGQHVSGIALSIAGFVNADTGRVIKSANASYLEGDLKGMLKVAFPYAKIRAVNDGEAHARSLLCQSPPVHLGAIHLALGTSLAFGVLNEKGEAVRTCSGENWDLGDIRLQTRAAMPEVYYALGSAGLRELEEKLGKGAYLQYGYRLGAFVTMLANIFRPRTVGFSGGIIVGHADEIRRGVEAELKAPVCSEKIMLRFLTEKETVMQGLTTLL